MIVNFRHDKFLTEIYKAIFKLVFGLESEQAHFTGVAEMYKKNWFLYYVNCKFGSETRHWALHTTMLSFSLD